MNNLQQLTFRFFMGFKQVVRVSDAFMMLKLNLFAAEQCNKGLPYVTVAHPAHRTEADLREKASLATNQEGPHPLPSV